MFSKLIVWVKTFKAEVIKETTQKETDSDFILLMSVYKIYVPIKY